MNAVISRCDQGRASRLPNLTGTEHLYSGSTHHHHKLRLQQQQERQRCYLSNICKAKPPLQRRHSLPASPRLLEQTRRSLKPAIGTPKVHRPRPELNKLFSAQAEQRTGPIMAPTRAHAHHHPLSPTRGANAGGSNLGASGRGWFRGWKVRVGGCVFMRAQFWLCVALDGLFEDVQNQNDERGPERRSRKLGKKPTAP